MKTLIFLSVMVVALNPFAQAEQACPNDPKRAFERYLDLDYWTRRNPPSIKQKVDVDLDWGDKPRKHYSGERINKNEKNGVEYQNEVTPPDLSKGQTVVLRRFLDGDVNENSDSIRRLGPRGTVKSVSFMECETIGGKSSYKFKVQGLKRGGRGIDGTLWIDAQTFQPLRENGRVNLGIMEKTIVQQINYQMEFENKDDLILISKITSQIDTTFGSGATEAAYKLIEPAIDRPAIYGTNK